MQRENALHPLALNDAAHREGLAHAFAAAGNDHTAKDLDALFLPLQDALVNIHQVADAKIRHIFLDGSFLDQRQQSILHGPLPLPLQISP